MLFPTRLDLWSFSLFLIVSLILEEKREKYVQSEMC